MPLKLDFDGAELRDSDLPEARQDLAHELGWADVAESVWEELIGYHRTDIEQAFGTQDWEDVAVLAREIQAAQRGRTSYKSPPGRPPTEERPVWQLKDEELERSRIFSEYVSRVANMDDNVRRFRSKYLDGGTITPDCARTLLTSPAAAIWPSLEFHVSGFPLLGHTHRNVGERHDDRGRYMVAEVYDAPSGVGRTVTDRRPLEAGAWSVTEQARGSLSNSEDAREIKGWDLLAFSDEEHGINRVCVQPGSVLGELRSRVHKLILRYPWQEWEATWFVLTGKTPRIAPVTLQARGVGTGDVFQRQFVTMKVEPWISEETVRRTYREAQVRMLRGDNRPAKSKQLDLFRFVSGRTDPSTLYGRERAKAAKTLVPEWDQENPADAYGADTRRFWRDYDRALELIALPMAAAKRREKERRRRSQ